ncbi:MAG: hypothetical protein VYE35_01320, partial [Chloroflexota bacterium]|nr:hypothetical protein [Chloroflexota bacterium]
MPSIYPGVIGVILAVFLIAACSDDTVSPIVKPPESVRSDDSQELEELPLWRYVNSGWVSPLNQQSANAFSRE